MKCTSAPVLAAICRREPAKFPFFTYFAFVQLLERLPSLFVYVTLSYCKKCRRNNNGITRHALSPKQSLQKNGQSCCAQRSLHLTPNVQKAAPSPYSLHNDWNKTSNSNRIVQRLTAGTTTRSHPLLSPFPEKQTLQGFRPKRSTANYTLPHSVISIVLLRYVRPSRAVTVRVGHIFIFISTVLIFVSRR